MIGTIIQTDSNRKFVVHFDGVFILLSKNGARPTHLVFEKIDILLEGVEIHAHPFVDVSKAA